MPRKPSQEPEPVGPRDFIKLFCDDAATLLERHWDEIIQPAGGDPEDKAKFAIGATLDNSKSPPRLTVKIVYGEKPSDEMTRDVDINQLKLFGGN